MQPEQPKKPLLLCILKILFQHSDEQHRLSQRDILRYLESEYALKADRKAVKRNLQVLLDFGFDIRYDEIKRAAGTDIENTALRNYYLVHEFTDGELLALMQGVRYAQFIPPKQANDLLERLAGLGSSALRKCAELPEGVSHLPSEVFSALEVLQQAIAQGRAVEFYPCEYGADGRRYYYEEEKEQCSPYWLFMRDGLLYVAACRTDNRWVKSFRIDHMLDVRLLPQVYATPLQDTDLAADGGTFMRAQGNLYSAASETVRFAVAKNRLGEVIDRFGTAFEIVARDQYRVTVSLTSNFTDFFTWAVRLADDLEVISPKSLRDHMGYIASRMAQNYKS